MRRPTLGRTAFAAVALLLAASRVPAAEVPTSAYANSVLVPVELLDDDNLVFLFPQHGMELDTQIQVTAEGSSFGVPAAGATGRIGNHAAMLLASDHVSVHQFEPITLAQAAWAAGGSRWRVGLAIRGSQERTASSSQRVEANGVVTSVRTDESVVRYSEAAGGFSWRGERAFLDIVGEILREDGEVSTFDSSAFDTSAFYAATNPKIRGRGAVRFSVPVSSQTELRGWGSYRHLSNSLDIAQVLGSTAYTARVDQYGHEWSVALAVAHESNTGLTRAYARYANSRPPMVPEGSGFGSSNLVRRKRDAVEGGFSLEQPIWWELRFLAGFRSAFILEETLRTRLRSNNELEAQSETLETLSQAFSWGLQRSIRIVDLTASLRTDLALTDLFVTLDAKVRFP